MGKLIEGLWDCSYCNTKGNRGSLRDCPNCGRPRGENIKFYMPGNISYLSEQKEKSINRKPDWLCAYCNSLNSDSLNICPSCGSERTSDNLDYFSIKEDNDNNLSLTTDKQDVMPIKDFTFNEKKDIKNNIENPRKGIPNFIKKHFKKIIGISLLLSLIIGMVFLFIPNNDEITIKQFEWTRSIEVERLQTVDESGWSLPATSGRKTAVY